MSRTDSKRSIVKLRSGASFGTGIIISENAILTARHVVDLDEVSTRGMMPDPTATRIIGAFSMGETTVDRLVFPNQPDVDLALALIHDPKGIPKAYCCAVSARPSSVINVGDEVMLHGFERSDGDVQSESLRIMEIHSDVGAYICNKAVPRGFSGGGVFSDDVLVGVGYARNHDKGRSYFYGGQELIALLKSSLAPGSVNWATGDVSPLRAYPIGPAVDPTYTTASLYHFINACVRLYGGARAIAAVGAANAARIDSGPAADYRSLVSITELPAPEFNPHGFWLNAVVEAGRKSPRMLAALLQSVDDEQLDPQATSEKAKVLRHLRGPLT